MSDKINYYQIPDKYWFRIHFVRPRFKSNIENVLLYMANECCRIPQCSCSEYNQKYLNAIKMFPGNIGMTKKTLDNCNRSYILVITELTTPLTFMRNPVRLFYFLIQSLHHNFHMDI